MQLGLGGLAGGIRRCKYYVSTLTCQVCLLLLRYLMMKMTPIQTLTHQVCFDGVTRQGLIEWTRPKMREKTLNVNTQRKFMSSI